MNFSFQYSQFNEDEFFNKVKKKLIQIEENKQEEIIPEENINIDINFNKLGH